VLPVTGFPLAAFVITGASLALCADVKAAMQAARITVKAAAIDLKTREPKLSDQLSGKEPFTLWWRFSVLDERFWKAFNDVRAQRYGQRVVASDIGTLIDSVEGLKRMAKMTLPGEQREEQSA
jgi:hypothetical protein